MMDLNFIHKFYSGDIHLKRNLLRQILTEMDVQFDELTFSTCFGFGCNFYIGPDIPSNPFVLVSAHYDGNSIYDNCGGVLQLLSLLSYRRKKQERDQVAYVLTDLEKCYQQGMYQFTLCSLFVRPAIHLNIDGIGVGDKLIVMPYDKFNSANILLGKRLVTDNRILSSNGIGSFQSFTLHGADFKITEGEIEFNVSLENYLNENWLLTESIIYNQNKFYSEKYNVWIEDISEKKSNLSLWVC